MPQIFQIFQIKKDELSPSIILFLHSFFLVSVIITSKTARDSFFLSRFDKSFLPLMYILTALIMWKGVGYIQKFLNGKNLLQQNIILHTSFALGTVLFIFFNEGIFVPILYLWVELVTALMGLKFWELATNIFNSRQGKRLFGIITSGGSLSAVITGMFMPQLVSYGTNSLIIFFNVGILLCMLIIFLLRKYFISVPRRLKSDVQIPKFYFSKMEPFIAHILFIIIILSSLSTFIDFQFKIEIGNQFSSDLQMMNFFGKFYMITGIISIIIQLFLSGRILSFFGVSAGISSYPLLAIGGSATLIFFSPFLAMSLIKGVDQVVKPTLLETTMNLLWLPISPRKQKFIKSFFNTTIKSIVQALSALLIIGLSTLNFGSISVYILIFGFSFMFMMLVLQTKSYYYDAVSNAIDSRKLNSDNFNLNFSLPVMQNAINSKLEKRDKLLLLFVLDIIKNEEIEPWFEKINILKSFEDRDVRNAVITFFGGNSRLFLTEELHEISESEEKYAPVAIQYLKHRTNIDMDRFFELVNSRNQVVQISILCNLYDRKKTNVELIKIQNQILNSESPQDILQYVDETSIYSVDFLHKLFKLKSVDIRLICLQKVDLSIYPDLIELVFNSLSHLDYKIEIINELLKIDSSKLIPMIDDYIGKNIEKGYSMIGIPQLLIMIENVDVKPLIEKLVSIDSGELLIEISNVISDSKQDYLFFIDKHIIIEKSQKIAKVIFQNIGFIYGNTFIAEDEFIKDYFKYKESEDVECLLRFACIILNNEPIDSYVHSIKNKDTQVPYIIELLEHKLPKSISTVLIPIIEFESSIEKFKHGSKFYKLNIELQKQCLHLYYSNDDWLQAIISYLIAKERKNNLDLDCINWEDLKSNNIIDDVIDMRKIEKNPITMKIINYINFKKDTTMFTMLDKITTLKKIDLFSNISSKDLYYVSQITEEVEFLEGEIIFNEGDFGDYMLIIVKGKVRKHKGEKTITEMGEWGCVGEMALLDGESRSADATATEDCILFKINQRDFSQVLSIQNNVMINIIKILTKRLRETSQQVYAS